MLGVLSHGADLVGSMRNQARSQKKMLKGANFFHFFKSRNVDKSESLKSAHFAVVYRESRVFFKPQRH